ncbi:hypothetical protein KUTeg_007624 [Tegillarca granosa]|uniref:Serum amyloid A protein n=1 Tax=Tegillarca granosa TaxID=220873 RepID=A0ABQ9FDS1_TEGGR|nr:hypothetical protein KUTeg_007624 [Tegillarca granosa]
MKFLLTIILVVCSLATKSTASSWPCIARASVRYIFTSEGRCSLNKMRQAYNEMRDANCRNCDKYFHCMANYNAVYNCQQSSTNRNVARRISDCRESGQNSADSRADQVANRYGRNGGNCGSRYLCEYGCYYNPLFRICSRSVCQLIA